MSNWNIFLANSMDVWVADDTVPRSNENLETTLTSTQQKIRLADGSTAYVRPETKRIYEAVKLTWMNTTSALRTKIETYMANGDKVKIVTHTGETFIGRFISMNRVWFVGIDDSYDVQVVLERMES